MTTTILLIHYGGTLTLEELGNLDQLNYLYLVLHPILLELHHHIRLVNLVLRVLPLAWSLSIYCQSRGSWGLSGMG